MTYVLACARPFHDCLGALDEFMRQMRLPRGSILRHVGSESDGIVLAVELPPGASLPECAERFVVEALAA